MLGLAEVFGGDPTPIIGGGTIVALVSISVTLLVRTARVVPQAYIDQIEAQGKANTALRAEVTDLRRGHARCERVSALLIRTMQQAGVEIPAEVWNDA